MSVSPADLVLVLGAGGPPAEQAYAALFIGVTRDPKATIPSLLDALEDARPVARAFPIAELRFSVLGAPISQPAVLTGERPDPLTVSDLAAVLIFNETRVDFGFRSDRPAPERAESARRLRAWWAERR